MFKFRVLRKLRNIQTLLEQIMATQQELVASLNAVNEELKKIGTETSKLLTKIDELQAAIDGGAQVSPELQAVVDALVAQAKVVDDLVPDPANAARKKSHK